MQDLTQLLEAIKPITTLLGGNSGHLVQIVVFIGSFRIPLKLISGLMKSAMESAIARVVATKDTEDDHFLEVLLKSRTYRVIAFLLDWIMSVKLPLDIKDKV